MKKITIGTLLIFSLFTAQSFAQANEKNQLKFKQPVLITSAGQSAEVQLASVLAKRADLQYALLKTAAAKDLKGIKTVLLVLGVSMKGLGAAGLDKAQEKKRINALIKEAQQRNIPLLCLHLGGEARRGALSDEFIHSFLPLVQMAIVTKSGNKDGLFSNICKEGNIPLIEVERAADALDPLKKIFR